MGYARALHYEWLDSVAREKHSSLLGPFVSYEEKEVYASVSGLTDVVFLFAPLK